MRQLGWITEEICCVGVRGKPIPEGYILYGSIHITSLNDKIIEINITLVISMS